MTLPGGPAAKLGIRYEKWWTLAEFVRLLRGDSDSIRLEEPGLDKAEFVVTKGHRRELHQAKRRSTSGKWSLADLRSDGLLEAIGEELAGNANRFVFASGSDAHELSELCDAVNQSASIDEFACAFLTAKTRKRPFEQVCRAWECDAAGAFERLRRIEVRPIGEAELREKVEWGLEALFIADPKDVQETLSAIAEDSIHKTITRQELVDALAKRGYHMRAISNPGQAADAIWAATDNHYLRDTQGRLIRQRLLPREPATHLLSRLDETPMDSVVTGKAGTGKTACVVQIVESARKRGMPVLALRLDRLTSEPTATAVGQRLGLEESPVLVLTAAATALDRPAVLVIDQLDAVSTMSGRTPDAFDLADGLLREVRGVREHVPIHTIVVCRDFDWEHDSQLRRLVSGGQQRVAVTEFTAAETKGILADAGYEAKSFRPAQLEILRLPQNLSLFLDADFDAQAAPAFDTAKQLFDRYWREKHRIVRKRASPEPDCWSEAVKTLCAAMTSTQQLSVPEEKLDGISPTYLDQMASEGVITFDGRRYGFGHESFFDYCFARLFAGGAQTLATFLERSEQHLFRRAQVRQVLTYLRDGDSPRYLRELRDLLSSDRIRTHLKYLAFALLAEVSEPTEKEWAIWKEWIDPELKAIEEGAANPNTLSTLAWRRFFGSRPWFVFADRRGLIESWLASSNDRIIDMAVDYLWRHQRDSPDRAATLLQPYADSGGLWPDRFRSFMSRINYGTSRPLFDLLLHLVDNGTLDEARDHFVSNGTFWSMLYGLEESRPDWVPEVLAHRLRRLLHLRLDSEDDTHPRQLIGYDGAAVRMLQASAKRAPAEFVSHVLPVVLEVSDSTPTGGTPPRRDAVWTFLPEPDSTRADDVCLWALAKALATVAGNRDPDLASTIANLRCRDTYTANFLLLSLYRGAPDAFADEALLLMCDEPWRLRCGRSDNPHWYAMKTLRAAFPHCTPATREAMEAVILPYVDWFERTAEGRSHYGTARFALLSAIPRGLRSEQANSHFLELQRKLGEPAGAPAGITGGIVGPPIREDAITKMTDDNWLQAIQKYPTEHLSFHTQDPPRGGARELAMALGGRAKEEPERFARLSLQLPPNANPVYLDRALAGLEKAPIEDELKLRVCRKAFDEWPLQCGKSLADVLGGLRTPIPTEAVEMLHWIATEHPEPESESRSETTADGRTFYGGDILTNGINSTRGRAAHAIASLISDDPSCMRAFQQTLDQIVRDASAAVISCVFSALNAVARHDRALGLRLFQKTNLSEGRVLTTRDARVFLRGAIRDSYRDVRPALDRMLHSSEPKVLEVGASMASLAALMHEHTSPLAPDFLRGNASLRLGVAKVAAFNIALPNCRAWCERTLLRLFDDEDAEVRTEAASCFRALEKEPLDTYAGLIASFCESKAYRNDSFWLLHTLERSRHTLPGMVCMAGEKFFDRLEEEQHVPGQGLAGDARRVVKLIFRTYQQHQNDEWAPPSLDLIDRLCLEGIYEVGSELDHFDR